MPGAKRCFPLWAVPTEVLQNLPEHCGAVQGHVQLCGAVTCWLLASDH